MRKLRLFGMIFCIAWAMSAIAQDATRRIVVANTFGSNAALQPNLNFAKFAQAMKSLPADTAFNVATSSLPSFVAYENVANGKVQMVWGRSEVFSPKDYAFTLFAHPPFIDADRYREWRAQPETVRTADALYAKHGLKAVPCSIVDSNMDFVLRRVPDAAYQYRGAKVGMFGPMQEIYSAIGIIPVAMPLAEFPVSLEKGLLDGAYTYTPYDSIEMRVYDATKVLVHPSVIRSFFAIDLIVNLQYWTGLPELDRSAIEGVCRNLVGETQGTSRQRSADAVEKYRKAGVLVMPLPEAQTQAIRLKWDEIATKRSNFEPVFEQLYKSLYRQ